MRTALSIIPLVFFSSFLSSCLFKNVESGAVTDAVASVGSLPFCPKGLTYDNASKLCTDGDNVRGPFTNAMVQKCSELGGINGNKDLCKIAQVWPKNLAAQARGNGQCPAGATKNLNGFCVEGAEAFGPFTKMQVAIGIEIDPGANAEELLRWSVPFTEWITNAAKDSSRSQQKYCQPPSYFDAASKLCLDKEKKSAFGPFTEAMKTSCESPRVKGGVACREKDIWSAPLAISLRGNGDCMLGAKRSASRLCIEGNNAFGPFSKALVRACWVNDGGAPCKSQRWNASFAEGLALQGKSTGTPNRPITPNTNNAKIETGVESEFKSEVSTNGRRLDVPYYCQRINQNEPSATCNNTALAMIEAYAKGTYKGRTSEAQFGIPDAIYCSVGKSNSCDLVLQAARERGFPNSEYYDPGTKAQIKNAIDRGLPVIAGGYFTGGSGHFIMIKGYDDKKGTYWVNDPWGKWPQYRAARYSALCENDLDRSSSSGFDVQYDQGAVVNDAGPLCLIVPKR